MQTSHAYKIVIISSLTENRATLKGAKVRRLKRVRGNITNTNQRVHVFTLASERRKTSDHFSLACNSL